VIMAYHAKKKQQKKSIYKWFKFWEIKVLRIPTQILVEVIWNGQIGPSKLCVLSFSYFFGLYVNFLE